MLLFNIVYAFKYWGIKRGRKRNRKGGKDKKNDLEKDLGLF